MVSKGECAVLLPRSLAEFIPRGDQPGRATWTLTTCTNTCSFYRGMGPPLLGVTPMFAVSFWVSELDMQMRYLGTG